MTYSSFTGKNKILHPVPVSAVKLKKGFWSSCYEKNWKYGIPEFLNWLERDG